MSISDAGGAHLANDSAFPMQTAFCRVVFLECGDDLSHESVLGKEFLLDSGCFLYGGFLHVGNGLGSHASTSFPRRYVP